MNAGRLLLGCLVALGLLVGVQSTSAEDKGTWTIIIKKVEVKQTNTEGRAWDVNNGKPDLAVIVRNVSDKNQKEFQTKTFDDTFTADFNTPTTVKFQPGQTLEFEVVDKDVAAHDSIGKVQKEFEKGLPKAGMLKLEKFGQVIFLELEVKKL